MSNPNSDSSTSPSSTKSSSSFNSTGNIASKGTGKKRALCIGINYQDLLQEDFHLKGCINDANRVAEFLISQFGFQKENVLMLTDDAMDPYRFPTKENIISAMRWLVKDAKPNDSLFFHYSGHSGLTEDEDGDEIDGYDEVIYPVDFQANGHIEDDLINELIVQPLPARCRLTALLDCSHAGTALDLPYVYTSRGKIKEPSRLVDAGQGLLVAGRSSMRGDVKGMIKGFGNMFKSETPAQKKIAQYARQTRGSPADVISWGGCKDLEQSDDVMDDKPIGAMSYAFIEALRRKPQQSYQELLNNIRALTREKYDQKPQLSSSHPINASAMFVV